MPEILPIEDFYPNNPRWDRVGARKSGGRSLSGISQRASTTGGGAHTATLLVQLRTANQLRRWRSYGARYAENGEPFELPFLGAGKVPLLGGATYEGIPHGDGSYFDDGAGYDNAPLIEVSFAQAYDLRDTEVQLNLDSEVDIIGGEPFSVINSDGARLHFIKSVTSRTATTITVKIDPPLRAAVTTATEVDFDNPRCLMRVEDGWYGPLTHLKFMDAAPIFVEHFDPQAA